MLPRSGAGRAADSTTSDVAAAGRTAEGADGDRTTEGADGGRTTEDATTDGRSGPSPGSPTYADATDGGAAAAAAGDPVSATDDGTDRATDGTVRSTDGSDRRRCSRRTLLAVASGTAGLAAPSTGRAATGAGAGATFQVFVYPGPTPLYARLSDGFGGIASGWTAAHRAATDAVADALAQVVDHAAATGRGRFDAAVERCEQVGARLGVASPLDVVAPASRVYDRFRDAVVDERPDAGPCCHLLLWWSPFDYEIGYGRTLPGTRHAALADGGALAVANVGATELWDGRAVTRNMAIHETLHAFLSPATVSSVVESRCDHDLGSVVESDPGVRVVSPMATAYAGPEGIGGGTRWQGRGCYDHDAFWRHDGIDGVEEWRYTTRLSDATREAVTRYADRHLG